MHRPDADFFLNIAGDDARLNIRYSRPQYAVEGNLEAVKDALDAIKKQGIADDLRAAAASLTSSSAAAEAREAAAAIIEDLDMADYSKVWCHPYFLFFLGIVHGVFLLTSPFRF